MVEVSIISTPMDEAFREFDDMLVEFMVFCQELRPQTPIDERTAALAALFAGKKSGRW